MFLFWTHFCLIVSIILDTFKNNVNYAFNDSL